MALLVSNYIEHFTYVGLLLVLILCGLGLPVPEDVALLAGGFMAHRGVTQYPITLAVSFIGVVAGDNTLYYVGRKFGSSLVAYLGIGRPKSQRQIDRLKRFHGPQWAYGDLLCAFPRGRARAGLSDGGLARRGQPVAVLCL